MGDLERTTRADGTGDFCEAFHPCVNKILELKAMVKDSEKQENRDDSRRRDKTAWNRHGRSNNFEWRAGECPEDNYLAVPQPPKAKAVKPQRAIDKDIWGTGVAIR